MVSPVIASCSGTPDGRGCLDVFFFVSSLCHETDATADAGVFVVVALVQAGVPVALDVCLDVPSTVGMLIGAFPLFVLHTRNRGILRPRFFFVPTLIHHITFGGIPS
jgi:hypothetical protein